MTQDRSAEAPVLPQATPLRMQILTTEHWSRLSSRGLAWNESFTRAGMYLSTLSGAMIALGLMGGVDDFGDAFVAFTVVILPVILFVGVATFLRLAAANYHDATCVLGMNRIRGAYLELAPDLEPYFVMGVHDDAPGVALTMAIPPGMPAIVHVIAATPFVIAVLNAVVTGAIAAIGADRLLGLGIVPTLAIATLIAVGMLATQLRVVAGNMRRGRTAIRSLFPTPRSPIESSSQRRP